MNDAFALSAADVAIVVCSLALTVFVGLWAARRPEGTAQGYFLASGRMPWWIIGTAFVSTSVSSEQIVGTVGAAFQNGMGIANWEWFALPMYVPLILFFIPVYLKNRVATVPEFLRRRYGPACADFYSWVMLVAYVVIFLVPVLYGGSLAFAELTGWNFYAVVWGMAGLVAVYTVKGGLASVMWTDAVQCLMLVGGGVALYFVALAEIPGGWEAMARANPDRFHLYRPADDPNAPFAGLLCGCLGVYLFYQATNQVMVQRVLAARSMWDGMMGIVFAGFINLVRPLVTCFLGFIVFHWIHELHHVCDAAGDPVAPLRDADTTFPFALKAFASGYGLRGVILAGFLAAVMSTVSALANSAATIFSLDVYRRFFNREATEAEMVRVGRGVSLLALAAAALACPVVGLWGGIFRYFQTGVTYLATPFISVILLGLFWRRATYAGGLFGLYAGTLIQAAVYLSVLVSGNQLHWLYQAFIAEVLTVAGVVLVSLASPPPERARWEPFRWTPALLRREEERAARPWWQSVSLWFGLYAAAWTYLYWRYW